MVRTRKLREAILGLSGSERKDDTFYASSSPETRAVRSSTTMTSGRAPTRIGGPQKPTPELTKSWVTP
jgi:hypothetical protein